jgi:hypothetical protein
VVFDWRTSLATAFLACTAFSAVAEDGVTDNTVSNAKVLVEGLRRAGRNLTREGLVRARESMQRVDFGGLMVTYGPNDHSGSEYIELTMIGKDGRFVR